MSPIQDVGLSTDAEAAGNGTLIALIKRLRTVLAQAVQSGGLSSDTQLSIAAGANTAAVATFLAAGAGTRWVLLGITAFYDVAPAAAQVLTVESPSGTIKLRDIVNGANTPTRNLQPVFADTNADLVVRLPAGGAGVSGRLSVSVRKSLMVTA